MGHAQQMLISYLATKNAIYHRDKVFLKDETHQVTFAEFEARTNALARGMMAQGVKAWALAEPVTLSMMPVPA